MSLGIKVLVFISVFCLNIGHVQGKIQTHVSTVYFDGILIYFPVRRSMLQARLHEINYRSADDDAKFFLPPEGTVFTDLLTRDQHVVMVVSGNSVATSFEEVLTYAQKESFSTRSNTLNFVFPLLTSSPGGLPELTLVLSRFTSTKTNFVDPNFALTTKILADDFEYTSNRSHIGISFTHGKTMKLKISGEVSELCRRHADIAGKDFMSINDELQISQQPPDFSVCDLLGNIDVDYCNAFRSYREDIAVSGSNVCQFWTNARNMTTCQFSIKVNEMSDKIKDILGLSHCEEPEAIKVHTLTGVFGIGLACPCV